ncbi:MAG: efflux RND transporter permease subunit [Isosphaeraceae bacterium]|nr:efflux RND transporter permease subunit [Isosphaeraceae bacterium]
MNGLIKASLKNPYAVTVMALTIAVIGCLSLMSIPVDILPVFNSPAVLTLTFYGGMPADGVANDITNRMERWVGQASGTKLQESRSIVGASIVRNYFQNNVDPNGALTQVNSLALGSIPNLPPGTLPPVVLPFDPTATTPACLLAVDSADPANNESVLYDVGRYEVRNMVMAIPGANAPVVYGGKVRAVMLYLDRERMQARGLSPLDVMKSMDDYNVFLPTGDIKLGETDYAIDSNSMFLDIKHMGDIPLTTQQGNAAFVRDVATPEDSNFIQTDIVRVNGRREVYIPVFRQLGSSTLKVVDSLKASVKDMSERLSKPHIDLKVVMDQSVFVRQSIKSLIQEGVTGGFFCVLVILLFLGQWKMTAIAGMTLPLSVLVSITCLYLTGNTINVMTLAGLTLAIGPMVDSAVICLENTERHLAMGYSPEDSAYLGASQVALPELVSTICTLLVLWPLALTSELGMFLFKPMALGVTFCMIAAYVLSRTLVPACSAAWLRSHGSGGRSAGEGHENGHEETFKIEEEARASRRGFFGRAWGRWERGVDAFFTGYVSILDRLLRHRVAVVVTAVALLAGTLVAVFPVLRRDFYPEVDSGAFEMTVRAPSGTRIERTEARLAEVEAFLKRTIAPKDLQLYITEIGVNADWSAAFTPNAGPMDAIVRVQLTAERSRSSQQYVEIVRTGLAKDPRFADLEFAFDAGGMIHAAMNEGKSTPISIRVTGKHTAIAHQVASEIRQRVAQIDGVVDARVIQRLNYPEYRINVDRKKAAELGLTQTDVMRNVVSAMNSSIQFNKNNFWIDPLNKNQYYVGVQYREKDMKSVETMLNVPVTGPKQPAPVPLRNVVSLEKTNVPTEVTHYNIQPTIEVTMGVQGRDLGHVADDVTRALSEFGQPAGASTWIPYDPSSSTKELLPGSKIVISGEYRKMMETFTELGAGLVLAAVLIYFLMVALDKSWVVPLTVMLTVPFALIGILLILLLTRTAINVQSVLGMIFIVGIKVSNTVLMTDYAQDLRREERLSPTAAIRKAASIRVRPVTMTALAAFFAMVPGALALERGSEANAPLARVILGGLLAGEPATLFILPMLYSLMVKDRTQVQPIVRAGDEGPPPAHA